MTSSERWLITGACGQLGGHVSALLRDKGANTLGLSRRRCAGDHGQVLKTDVTCRDALDRILAEFEPTHIVHTAGIAAPARAQHQQAAAWQIHVAVTQHLAAFAAATGGWLLYPSTDFVWDGHAEGRYRETDSPRPGTYYGRCKLAGEQAVLDAGAGAAVRFSLLLGQPICPRESTWTRIAAAIVRGDTVPACIDEFRTPLSFFDAANIAVELGTRTFRGLIHAAGPDVLTSYEMMTRIALALGATPTLREISRRDLSEGASRPRSVAMDASALSALLPDHQPESLSIAMLTKIIKASN